MMYKDIYFFDDNQKLIKVVGDEKLFSVVQEKEITPSKEELINDKLSVSTVFDDEIKEATYMAVREDESSFSMYKIIGVADVGELLMFTAINFGAEELDAYIISDIRPSNEPMRLTLQRVIDHTEKEWRLGYIDSVLPNVTTNFYYCSVKEALKNLQTFGCEIEFKCTVTGEGVTDKWIDVYRQIGEYSNERYEYGGKALTIEREFDRSNVFTSLIGRGRGEEVGDGYGRRIEFDQVLWQKSKGDPLDKPMNQINLEFPEMTEKYGIPTKSGKRRKREKVVIFEDCEDPQELIRLTYAELIAISRPLVQFKATIFGADKLGNIVRIHRADRNYHYETRIFGVKIDRLTGAVETSLGDNLNTSSTRQASNTQNAIQSLDESKMTFYESTEVSKWQSDIIRGAKGGSIIMMNPWDTGKGESRQPYQMVWMNGDSIDTSNHFLVANSEGIGFIDGKFNEANFKTAWTIDGNFNANFIQSGKIRADIFETSFNAYGDQLKLSGGALQAVNNGKKLMELTKKGMEFWGTNKQNIGHMGVVTDESNPFRGYAIADHLNNMLIRTYDKDILFATNKDKGMLLGRDGKLVLYKGVDVYQREGGGNAANFYGDVEFTRNVNIKGQLTLNGQQVFPGQGGGASGSIGGQGNNWNGQYPPEVSSQADKFAWQAWVMLLSLGYSKAAAAGILGNINGESGPAMNPDIDQIGGPAYGAIQFDGSSYPLLGAPTYNGREYVQRLMNAAGIKEDYRQMAPQMRLVDWANHNGQWIGAVQPLTVAGFKAIGDPSQAAYAFEKNFERPRDSHPDRQGYAVTWYNKFKDLQIPQANSDIVTVAKSMLNFFTYQLIHGEAYIGSVQNVNPNGVTDCSGYVWLVLAKAGYRVPGNMQWYTGSMTGDARGAHRWFQEIAPEQSKAGDVVIYNVGGGAGANGHTAILLESYRGSATQIIQMGGDGRWSGVNISTIGYSFGSLLGGDRCIARALK